MRPSFKHLPHPVLSAVTWMLLTFAAPASPSAFSERVMAAPAPPAAASGAFAAVARWDGRLFVHHDLRTWWSADAGRTWKSRDWVIQTPKGPVPLLEGGWFTRTSQALWLGNRSGALAWRYDASADDWTDSGCVPGAMAAAGAGDGLYVLSADHGLRVTRDRGVTWSAIPVPDSVRVGTYFDDVLAEGDRIILRVRDAGNSQRAAVSADGGRSWNWLTAHAAVGLAHGCVYALREGRLESDCGAGSATAAVPFGEAQALFADATGSLFALSDSTLYRRTTDAPEKWQPIAGREDLRGWTLGRDVLFCLRDDSLNWFNGAPAPTAGIRIRIVPERGGLSAPPRFQREAGRLDLRLSDYGLTDPRLMDLRGRLIAP